MIDDFVRAWPDGALAGLGLLLLGTPEEVVGRAMEFDLVRGPDDEGGRDWPIPVPPRAARAVAVRGGLLFNTSPLVLLAMVVVFPSFS